MPVKSVGIISGGTHAQAHVNIDHAKDLEGALSAKYSTKLYDLSKPKDFEGLLKDRRQGKLDIVFNNAAGKQGGDGTVEGLLELMNIPFVGSDTLATAIAFDKKTTKTVVKAAGVTTIRGLTITSTQFLEEPEETMERLARRIRVPMIIKASGGSDSIGVSLVKKEEEIIPAMRLALKQDDTVIVEDFIRRKAEITCMVIGNGDAAYALEPVERVYQTEILYSDSKRTYRLPVIPEETKEGIMKAAVKAHRAVGCSDYSRSDFLVGQKGRIYFLELNAHAGLGNSGPTAFACAQDKHWSYPEMVNNILMTAIKRYGRSVFK